MNQLKPVHPGDILSEDLMKPMKLTGDRLAKGIHVPAQCINDIIYCKPAVTTRTFGWPVIPSGSLSATDDGPFTSRCGAPRQAG